MIFNELAHLKLDIIFQKYNLKVVREFENYIKLQSNMVVIALGYDKREDAGFLYAGKDDSSLMLIDGDVINRFFIMCLENHFIIPEKTQEDYVNNILHFFSDKGRILLEGDVAMIRKIEIYIHTKNRVYSSTLLLEQNLISADEAWEINDYLSFINYINMINIEVLPPSYALKYKIASQKLLEK